MTHDHFYFARFKSGAYVSGPDLDDTRILIQEHLADSDDEVVEASPELAEFLRAEE